ncbi:MAG TPA: hypothetical protein VNC50_11180, partial [Planctomycetia bacterium]|nr:hypothetical protein [Planctomycetia bacterium]
MLRKIPAEAVFLLVVFLFLLGAGRKQMFADPGALWHPVTGEKVLTEGFFRGDPYGFREYHDWFAKDWLAEVIFAYAHRWAGPDGMLLVPAGVLALFYTFVFHRLLRAGCHWTFATLLALAALAASAFHFFCRPLIFTL